MGEAAEIEAFGGVDYLVNNAAIYGGMQIESLPRLDGDYYQRSHGRDEHATARSLCTCGYCSMHQRGGGAIVNQLLHGGVDARGFYGIASSRAARPHHLARGDFGLARHPR